MRISLRLLWQYVKKKMSELLEKRKQGYIRIMNGNLELLYRWFVANKLYIKCTEDKIYTVSPPAKESEL